MKLLITAIIAGSALIGGATSGNETLTCEIEPLETYGFEQFSDSTEYVCVNSNDFTDFIIVEDENDEYHVGNTLKVTLKHDEVTSVELNEQ